MDTDDIIRARQLKELYEDVTAPIETYDRRLEVLLLLKCTVKVCWSSLACSVVHCRMPTHFGPSLVLHYIRYHRMEMENATNV